MLSENSFQRLDPDFLLKSMETIGFEPTGRCIPLNSVENRVYDIEVEGNVRYVVKYYRPHRWTKDQIQEEHNFLDELQAQEIPVLTPIKDESNQSIFEYDNILFAVWPLRTGRIIEEIAEADLVQLGRLLGRIHLVGKSKKSLYRPKLDITHYAGLALELIKEGSWIQNQNLLKRYEKAAHITFQTYEDILKIQDIPFQRIHGDCHKGNLLYSKEGFSILDFDDFLEGPVIQDFWMLLPFGGKKEEYERELFFEGYKEFSDFSHSWLKLIEPLRGIRYVHYAAWIAKRWQDPSFPNLFPHFGTEEYWLNETLDLEKMGNSFEMLDEKDEVTIDEKTSSKKEELSNKDFFWDWEG
ncbi:MAG: serine/threonine protein kinase [Leptospira sp.]|nr:serine/threonine protein kinase [Leptospira sp.]